jgi:antitoxin component HigA of HigAB toxin-antitoxin module
MSEEEYKECLKVIETLMDSDLPEEGAELLRLVEMVEAYEDEHYPMGDNGNVS